MFSTAWILFSQWSWIHLPFHLTSCFWWELPLYIHDIGNCFKCILSGVSNTISKNIRWKWERITPWVTVNPRSATENGCILKLWVEDQILSYFSFLFNNFLPFLDLHPLVNYNTERSCVILNLDCNTEPPYTLWCTPRKLLL